MFLKEIQKFQPKKHAYFLNQNPLIVTTHPSSQYLAFSTRQADIVVYNKKTAKLSIYLHSKHGILSIMFTQKYLIAVEKGYHQILIFSLKTEKLKKKITGHRNQVMKTSYCPQRKIFSSISRDVCIIWDEVSLNMLKLLKCSTSYYADVIFSGNGEKLITSFSDGTIFNWNLDDFEYKQQALSPQPYSITCNLSQFLLAYNKNEIWASSFCQNIFKFEKIQSFWEGTIEKIEFLKDYIVIKTSQKLYISEIRQQHRILMKNIKILEMPLYSFFINCYQSQLLIINSDLTEIKSLQIFREASSKKVLFTNPLLNDGQCCSGGFNQKGCMGNNQLQGLHTHQYQNQAYKVQNLNAGFYNRGELDFSFSKLQAFIRKNHLLPDKYRCSAYKFLLGLPISQSQYQSLLKRKRHQTTELLSAKYPLENQKLFEAFQNVVSLLANYNSIFGESAEVPGIAFPFVCLFGNDEFFCFQILYKLFNHWLKFLFENFPVANSSVLENLNEILENEDEQLLRHLQKIKGSFTKLFWGLLSNLFTTVAKRQVFLAIIDTLFCYIQEPNTIFFMAIGFVLYNKSIIFNLKSSEEIEDFLNHQHNMNVGKFLKKVFQMKEKYGKKIRYQFDVLTEEKSYKEFRGYPEYAVKLAEGRSNLELQQYQQSLKQKKYHENLAKQIETMVVIAKRKSKKTEIEADSIALHHENRIKNEIKINQSPNSSERRKRLQKLLVKIEQMVMNSQKKKNKVSQLIPSLKNELAPVNDSQLDKLEEKLMTLLTKLEPNQFQEPLKSQPIPVKKQKLSNNLALKSSKNANVAKQLWEIDEIRKENQEENWNNDFIRAI